MSVSPYEVDERFPRQITPNKRLQTGRKGAMHLYGV
jgi:hypothetical protein